MHLLMTLHLVAHHVKLLLVLTTLLIKGSAFSQTYRLLLLFSSSKRRMPRELTGTRGCRPSISCAGLTVVAGCGVVLYATSISRTATSEGLPSATAMRIAYLTLLLIHT
jgi:hypothetical protein